ncbi:CLCN3 [Cordylochernes scorpioides]|uniref:CLCN3 n=1 Tax=Cordylochernes scorpioides TaxID=51811 RepID=A0ABY6KIF5_9ARAC|nr:CLCN3 [Cordylochernes scorpioides]
MPIHGVEGEDEPKNEESRLCKSKLKVLLVPFFDIKGVVLSENLEEGQTINKKVYLDILRLARESIRLKRKEMGLFFTHFPHMVFIQYILRSSVTARSGNNTNLLEQPRVFTGWSEKFGGSTHLFGENGGSMIVTNCESDPCLAFHLTTPIHLKHVMYRS